MGWSWKLREKLLKLSKAGTGGFIEAGWWPGFFWGCSRQHRQVVSLWATLFISPFKTTVLWTQAAHIVMWSETFLSFAQCTGLLPSPFQSRYLDRSCYLQKVKYLIGIKHCFNNEVEKESHWQSFVSTYMYLCCFSLKFHDNVFLLEKTGSWKWLKANLPARGLCFILLSCARHVGNETDT